MVIQEHLGKITKREILDLCPDISASTVEIVLSELVKDQSITKIGDRKNTAYYYSGNEHID